MENFNLSLFQNSVVQIISSKTYIDWESPYKNKMTKNSIGTGFFISKNHILTCSHVLENSHSVTINISFSGCKEYRCHILGICPQIDIAIIEVVEYESEHICPLGSDLMINSGDDCIVLGYPLGQSNLKVTKGVISGQQYSKYQIDTPISSGNSGGPLVRNNKVIGILVSSIVLDNAQNVNYAIPIKHYYLLKDYLYQPRYLIHYPEIFGFEYQAIDDNFRKYHQIEQYSQRGIMIINIIPRSLISSTSLKIGDFLLKINDIFIDQYGLLEKTWMNQKMNFKDLLMSCPFKSSISISYYSVSKKQLITEKFLLQQHKLSIRELYPPFEPIDYIIYAGLIIMPLNLNFLKTNNIKYYTHIEHINFIKYQFDKYRSKRKIAIINILKGSIVDKLNIFSNGFIITKINHKEIGSMNDVREAIVHNLHSDIIVETENLITAILNKSEIDQEFIELSSIYRYNAQEELDKIHKYVDKQRQLKQYLMSTNKSRKLKSSELMISTTSSNTERRNDQLYVPYLKTSLLPNLSSSQLFFD